MAFIEMEMTGALVLMCKLAKPAAPKRHEGGVTTNPLLTTAGLDQRRLIRATKATMLSRNRFRFHPVVSQGLSSIGHGGPWQVDTQAVPRLYYASPSRKGPPHLVVLNADVTPRIP